MFKDLSHEELVELVASLSARVSFLESKANFNVDPLENFVERLAIPAEIKDIGIFLEDHPVTGETFVNVAYSPSFSMKTSGYGPSDPNTSFGLGETVSHSTIFNTVEDDGTWYVLFGGGIMAGRGIPSSYKYLSREFTSKGHSWDMPSGYNWKGAL